MPCRHLLNQLIGYGRLQALSAKNTQRSDGGLTLIECLVAIVMVAVTGALMTPPLFLAAATRVQNRRSEQALQIAQGEIDLIRTLVERNEQQDANLPDVVVVTDDGGNPQNIGPDDLLRDTPAPTALVPNELKSPNESCNTFDDDGSYYPDSHLQALEVDIDGDCSSEFFVQYFRDEGTDIPSDDTKPGEFRIGVRVYAIGAEANLGRLSTLPASLNFTSGEGNQRQRPLAVISTEVVESDSDTSICQYYDVTTLCN